MAAPIVVGVHPRRDDNEPVALAAMLSRLTHAPLEAVSTFWFDATPGRTAAAEYETRLRQRLGEALSAGPHAGDAEQVAVRITTRPGSAPRLIHEAAERVGAGLIVVGPSQRGAVGKALGSTAERVLDGAPCPVAVAPRGFSDSGRAPERIGVAFIDTPEGREALRAGAATARAAGGVLIVYTAVGDGDGGSSDDSEARLEAAIREEAGDLDARGEVLAGGISALVEATQELDLLLTGSRGYGPVRATILGGVSRRLAREAACPLIVTSRGVQRTLADVFAEESASPAPARA